MTEPLPGIVGLEIGLDKGTTLKECCLSSRGGRCVNSYRTVRSMFFLWNRLYYIAEKTLGF